MVGMLPILPKCLEGSICIVSPGVFGLASVFLRGLLNFSLDHALEAQTIVCDILLASLWVTGSVLCEIKILDSHWNPIYVPVASSLILVCDFSLARC